MCTTCNCFKHKSKDIYYIASGAPGTDAAVDALAAVGVDCSSSSSSELHVSVLAGLYRVGVSANGVAHSTQEV